MGDSRDELLGRLQRSVDAARVGRSSTLLIRGDVGVGKSWLLDRFVAVLGADVRILRGTGHPAEAELPFAGLHQVAAPLLHRLAELPSTQADALSAALALAPGEPGDRLAVSAGLLGLITLEAESRPVVLVIDDLHWLDISTRQALTFVARRIDADAVAIVLAGRPEPSEQEHGAGFERVELRPMDAADSRRLLREQFPDLNASATTRILSQAAGLPLALTQIPADLSRAQRAGEAPLPEPLPLGATLTDFYTARMVDLGRDGRLALATASLDGLSLGQLAAALGTLGLSLESLESAERAGLLRITGEGYAFFHPTVRAAALQAVTSSELRRARAAIIEALPPGSSRTATHLDALATGLDDATADALDAAGIEAWNRSAYEEAGRAWQASAGRSTDSAAAAQRRTRAVEAFLRCGAWARLGVLLRELVDGSTSEAEQAQWQSLLLIAGLYSDARLPDRAEIEQLAASVSTEFPAGASRLLTSYALVLMLGGDFREASSIVDHVRELLPSHRFALADALVHDDIDLIVGRPGAGSLISSDWVDELTDEQLCDPSTPMSPVVTHMAWTGTLDTAERAIERQLEALHSRGGISLLDICLAQRAAILQLRGRWDEAHSAFSSAAELARAGDFTGPLLHIELRHAYFLAARGDETAARDLLARVATVPASAHLLHRHLALCAEGLLDLTTGNAERAAESFASASRLEEEMGLGEPGFQSRAGDQFEAVWRLRREDEAFAILAALEQQAASTGRLSAQAIALRCRGLTADATEVDTLFAEALRAHEHQPDPFEIARTELAWGQRLRRDRRKAQARVPLHRALDLFQGLGAAPWAEVVLAELAACGERRAGGDVGTAARRLTPRELEVALAVARGASNAEAAARLFVSKKTVEYHLAGVYRKLGVANRSELAQALAN